MITVLQIVLGELPYYLAPCMQSVYRWSSAKGYKHIVLTDDDCPYHDRDDFDYLRHCSDYMRLDWLSKHERTLYIDWDIFLRDIIIDDESKACFAPFEIAGGIIYNGDELELFKKLRVGIEPRAGDRYPMMARLRSFTNMNAHQKIRGTFAHMDHCQIVKQSYELT